MLPECGERDMSFVVKFRGGGYKKSSTILPIWLLEAESSISIYIICSDSLQLCRMGQEGFSGMFISSWKSWSGERGFSGCSLL